MATQTATKTFSITELIEEHLVSDNEADPSVIAMRVAAEIPRNQLRPVVAELLVNMVRVQESKIRIGLEKNTKNNGSGKWREIRKDHESGVLDIRRWRIYVPIIDKWLFLGDLEKSHVLSVAEAYQSRADQNLAWKAKYEQVADLLQDGQKVSDISHDKLKEIFT